MIADNPETGSGELDTNSAAALIAGMLDPQPEAEPPKEEEKAQQEETAEPAAEPEVEAEASEDDPVVTIKIDGKDVEVKLSELKNGYQRQADYTRKTMEAAEQRKAATAETEKARQERQAYAMNLQKMQAQLEGALQEQQQIDWDKLIQENPIEALRQQHLQQQRQAALEQNQREQEKVYAQFKAEQEQAQREYLKAQQEELLAKLPDWKDEAKAKAEKAAIKDYLLKSGYAEEAVNSVSDAKAVLLARKAMLYDQMVNKAQAAAKKVSTLPTKVERPGVSETQGLDRRTAAYQRLSKSGKVEDAAAVFANLL